MRNFLGLFILLWACSVWGAGYGSIDSYVQRAPEIKNHGQLDKVVHYITKKYQKDEEKAYAILTWIVHNIDYDDFYYRQVDNDLKSRRDLSRKIPEQGDIISTRLGVCKDIAQLYAEMLKKADIDSRVIHGCLAPKGDKSLCQLNPHAWNAVWIEKQWELVDPTFAMGQAQVLQDITSLRAYDRKVKKRQHSSNGTYKSRTDRKVEVKWFMTDPKIMVQDHQPSDAKWYLTKKMDRKKKD